MTEISRKKFSWIFLASFSCLSLLVNLTSFTHVSTSTKSEGQETKKEEEAKSQEESSSLPTPLQITDSVRARRLNFEVNTKNAHVDFFFNAPELRPHLIRTASFGEANLDFSQEEDSFEITSRTPKRTSKATVVQPTYKAYQFVAVEQLVATINGEEFVFDSDDFDVNLAEKSAINPVAFAYSNNPKSINSKFFKENIGKATKLSIIFKDLNWVNNKGEKTKYKVVPEDFLFGLLNQLALNKEFRMANGGDVSLELALLSLTNSPKFKASRSDFKNFLNGIDIDYNSWLGLGSSPLETYELVKEVKTENKEGREEVKLVKQKRPAFSVYLKPHVGLEPKNNQMSLFVDHSIIDAKFPPLVPSQFLIENANSFGDPLASFRGSGLLKKIGYYWYGYSPENQLFISPYYIKEQFLVKSQSFLNRFLGGPASTFVLAKNNFYQNQTWVEDFNNVREINYEFFTRSNSVHYETIIKNFLSGRSSFLDLSDIREKVDFLTKNQLPKHKEPEQLPISKSHFSNVLNTTKIPVFPQMVNVPSPKRQSYSYNDIYAKFMFGSDKKSISVGEAKPLKTFFGNDQIAFRSILLSAVNYAKAVHTYSNGENEYTLTFAPLFAKLGGRDQFTSQIKTTYDALELANSPFTVIEGKRKTNFSYLENLKAITNIDSSMSEFLAGGESYYHLLQDEMTALLDKVFLDNEWSVLEDKLEFALGWWLPVVDSEGLRLVWKGMEDTINGLDRKGRIKLMRLPSVDFLFGGTGASIVKNKEASESAGVYEYQGNGNYLTAALLGSSTFYVGFLSQLLAKNETDADNPFPMLTRLAKLLQKAIAEGKYKFAFPMEKWVDLDNNTLHSYEETFQVQGFALTPTEIFKEFFLSSQQEFTNEELIKLNVEIAVLSAPSFYPYSFLPHHQRTWSQILVHDGLHIPDSSQVEDYYYDPVEL